MAGGWSGMQYALVLQFHFASELFEDSMFLLPFLFSNSLFANTSQISQQKRARIAAVNICQQQLGRIDHNPSQQGSSKSSTTSSNLCNSPSQWKMLMKTWVEKTSAGRDAEPEAMAPQWGVPHCVPQLCRPVPFVDRPRQSVK